MDRVAQILKEEDLGGAFILVGPEDAQYHLRINPSWSGVELRDPDGPHCGVRINLDPDDYDKTQSTGRLLHALVDTCARWAIGLKPLAAQITLHPYEGAAVQAQLEGILNSGRKRQP